MRTNEFKKLSNTELFAVCGGGGLGLGDWVTDYFNMVGKALHDWFGCVKCKLHFF